MTAKTDDRWIELFIAELRLRGVPGDLIGDAVASVRELTHDSGESAAEAFGTPHDYAASLDLPVRSDAPWDGGLAPATLALVALIVYIPAVTRFLQGEAVLVSVWQAALLGAALVFVVAAFAGRRRAVLRGRWTALIVSATAAGAAIVSALLTPADAADAWLVLPALPVVVCSAAVLVGAAIWQYVATVRSSDGELVRDPFDGRRRSDLRRTVSLVTPWILPAVAIVYTAVFALALP